MGRQWRVYLSARRVYGCSRCKNHLSVVDSTVSKAFNGQHGRAFLVDFVVNVRLGEQEERTMSTGLHVVRDIYCIKCGTTVGWKYDRAYQSEQKYKEGKYILEKNLLVDVE
jgi:hypothetical protein